MILAGIVALEVEVEAAGALNEAHKSSTSSFDSLLHLDIINSVRHVF